MKAASRSTPWLPALALCAITLLAYSNSFTAGFTLDSRGLVLEDARVHQATAANAGLILQHTYWWPYGESGLYRPFTTLTYLFNYAILDSAAHPAGYHWLNFLLHAVNVLLLYALALRLVGKVWPAFFAAALWAVHPVLTESVTNIAGRADLLAGMALLAGLWMYLKSREAHGWGRCGWLAGLAAMAAIGVFSKENAVVIAAVLALYEFTWWKGRKGGRALLFGGLAVAPALAAMWYARSIVFAHLPAEEFPFWDNPLTGAGFWPARLTAVTVLARYLGLLVWPVHLSCDYSYAQIPLETGSFHDWLAWMAVAAVAAGALLMWRWNRTVFFAAGFAFLTLLPASNLVVIIGTIMAERFLYLPAIALAVCLVAAVYAFARRIGHPGLAPALLCAIAAAFAQRTWTRNLDWRDDRTLAEATVRAAPASYRAHKMLAAALYDGGAGRANIARAIAEAEKGIAILDPLPPALANSDAYHEAGVYYLAQGDLAGPHGQRPYQRALELFLRCKTTVDAGYREMAARQRARGGAVAELDAAKVADLERAISFTYLKLDQPERAVEAASSAAEMEPLDARSYQQLAASLVAAARLDDAAVTLMEGALVTSDMSLRERLLRLYQAGLDTAGCAIVAGPNGAALNPECGVVRRHSCAAAAAAIRTYARLGRPEPARQLEELARQQFGCR